MKNKRFNIIILLIALFLVFYFSLKDDISGVIKIISKINIFVYIFAIFVFFASLFIKSLSLNIFIKEYYSKYSRFKTYILILIGQFLNGVTPFNSGGQPFQIYLLKKEGLRITTSTKAMIKDGLSYQISLLIIEIICLIINGIFNIFDHTEFKIFIMIGFFINLFVLLIIIFLISYKELGVKLVNKIINSKLFKKLKIDKKEIYDNLEYFYQINKEVKKNKFSFLKSILLNIIFLILTYILPFLIFLSLGITNINIFYSLMATSFVYMIGSFVPIPGATGGIEFGFYKFFGIFVTGVILSSGLLLWRTTTYIFGMFIGFVALILKKEVKKCE